MKTGIVALIGRPNVGKSTLLNNLLGQKVSITSPKPQTTRFNIQAVYEDNRGQILFIDTPGVFGKVEDTLAQKINLKAREALQERVDLIIYMIDHARQRSFEENKTLGIVRSFTGHKILLVNKIDVKMPDYYIQYKFIEDEVDEVIQISALKRLNLNVLIERIFTYLSDDKPIVDTTTMIQPGLNLDSRVFLSELVREKAFLFLRSELPYTLTTVVDEFQERANGSFYVRARILTTDDKYKKMIIGKEGRMIREISMAVRKELETARGKKVFVELTVETDPHWVENM